MVLGGAGLVVGGLGAWGVARHAGKFGLVDHPNERSSHDTITPRGGGVGILGAFLLSAIGVGMSPWFWLPLGVMAALAFLGDWVELSPKIRLPVQLLLAGIVVAGFWTGGGGGWAEIPLFLFWVLFIAGTAHHNRVLQPQFLRGHPECSA